MYKLKNDASDLIDYRYDLYNGNIGTMGSTVTIIGNNVAIANTG